MGGAVGTDIDRVHESLLPAALALLGGASTSNAAVPIARRCHADIKSFGLALLVEILIYLTATG